MSSKIRLLIADDEPYFRKYMAQVVDWAELGFEITAIVKNGEEAMEVLKRREVHIALLDINMPGLNGIALTERLKELDCQTMIVFITGYSEFEYARKALQLGVYEYILKPFTKEELVTSLLRLKLMIEKQETEEKHAYTEKKIVRGELLKEAALGQFPGGMDRLMELLKRVGIVFWLPYFSVCAVEIDTISDIWNQPDEINLWKFGITNIISEMFEQKQICQYYFYGNENRIFFVMNLSGEEREEQRIRAYLDEAAALIHEYFGFTVTVGIGSAAAGLQGVPDSYQEALAALQNKFLEGAGRVIPFTQIKSNYQTSSFYRLHVNDELLKALQSGEKERFRAVIGKVEEEIHKNQFSIDYIYMMIGGMLSICLSFIAEMDEDIEEVLGNGFSPYQQLYGKKSLEECFMLLDDMFGKITLRFSNPRSKRIDEIIHNVESYVEAHYQDPELTVEQIALELYLDSSYIRKIFSRYVKCTVSEYIIRVRMKAARRLLEQHKFSIADISEQVGYSEAGYFSKCFKKYYGVAPKTYSNQIQIK